MLLSLSDSHPHSNRARYGTVSRTTAAMPVSLESLEEAIRTKVQGVEHVVSAVLGHRLAPVVGRSWRAGRQEQQPPARSYDRMANLISHPPTTLPFNSKSSTSRVRDCLIGTAQLDSSLTRILTNHALAILCFVSCPGGCGQVSSPAASGVDPRPSVALFSSFNLSSTFLIPVVRGHHRIKGIRQASNFPAA